MSRKAGRGAGRVGLPRWLWFAPVCLLLLGVAMMALRLGWLRANLTETDVIEVYVARYLAEAGAGARATDCVARPGAGPGVWIVVTCSGAQTRVYPVNRWGRLLDPAAVLIVPDA